MSIKVVFPGRPSEKDIELFDKAVKKFAKVSVVDEFRQRSLINKAKTPIEILACKYIVQYRHGEIMKLIRKKEREINKLPENPAKEQK